MKPGLTQNTFHLLLHPFYRTFPPPPPQKKGKPINHYESTTVGSWDPQCILSLVSNLCFAKLQGPRTSTHNSFPVKVSAPQCCETFLATVSKVKAHSSLILERALFCYLLLNMWKVLWLTGLVLGLGSFFLVTGSNWYEYSNYGRRWGPPVRGAGYEPGVYIRVKCSFSFTNISIGKRNSCFVTLFISFIINDYDFSFVINEHNNWALSIFDCSSRRFVSKCECIDRRSLETHARSQEFRLECFLSYRYLLFMIDRCSTRVLSNIYFVRDTRDSKNDYKTYSKFQWSFDELWKVTREIV